MFIRTSGEGSQELVVKNPHQGFVSLKVNEEQLIEGIHSPLALDELEKFLENNQDDSIKYDKNLNTALVEKLKAMPVVVNEEVIDNFYQANKRLYFKMPGANDYTLVKIDEETGLLMDSTQSPEQPLLANSPENVQAIFNLRQYYLHHKSQNPEAWNGNKGEQWEAVKLFLRTFEKNYDYLTGRVASTQPSTREDASHQTH